jgi:4-hydroxybenzoate polyprenyltransferase
MHDIESDRRHPNKSKARPLAAGVVSLPAALSLLVVLYATLVWGWFVAPEVVMVIAAYLVLNFAYTFVLKYQPVVDIFTIAIGFVLRVHAGAEALEVSVSSWMFITTLCLALYLAAIKRRQELNQSGAASRKVLEKYPVSLVERYAEMSATGALLFYSMFVMSAKPELVITIPLVLFGLFRYWFAVQTLHGGESPTDALLADWQLLLTVGLWVAACGWVLWPVVG